VKCGEGAGHEEGSHRGGGAAMRWWKGLAHWCSDNDDNIRWSPVASVAS
jgi:hypothetical protein